VPLSHCAGGWRNAEVPQSSGNAIPLVDLFAGPGGLGEEFAATGRLEAETPYRVALSIEKEERAHHTLLLRSFFRQFPYDDVPQEYYAFLGGELPRDDLFAAFPREAAHARREARRATLGEADERQVDR